jgi:hypothetical protein
MRGTALSCVALLSGGCSLLLSTSDFSEDATDAGAPVEASSPADAPSLLETSTDAPVVPPDGGGPRFCASLSPAPKFCADFDGEGAVDEGWNGLTIDPTSAGTVTRDPLGRDRSSLLVKLTAPKECSYVRPGKSFVTTGKGMRISFSFRPSSPWDSDAIFAFIKLESPQGGCSILHHLESATSANLHFQYGVENDLYAWNAVPKLDTWSRVETSFGSDGSISIKVDGVDALTRGLDPACTFGDSVYVALGFHCEDAVHEARFDDVVIDYP